MKTKMITISENLNTFGRKQEIYNYCIIKNGHPDSMEKDLIDMLLDMNKRGFIKFNKFNELYNYEFSKLSLSNIKKNLRNPIINLSDNLELIKEKIIIEV